MDKYKLVEGSVAVQPVGCVLWREELDADFRQYFEEVEEYHHPINTDADHRSRSLLRCRECGQLYYKEFLEWIDWQGGNDPMHSTYIPIGDSAVPQTTSLLHSLSALQLLYVQPSIRWDFPQDGPPTVHWER